MSSLKLYENYKNDQNLRNRFFEFTPKALFGADFKQWYLKGGWNDRYRVYSLGNSRKILSNVSFSTMELYLMGNRIKGTQLATVATLPEYQNQGLSRQLMKIVLEKCDRHGELVFLFANKSVLNFYPKFGFEPVQEYLFQIDVSGIKSLFCANQLNINSKTHFKLIRDLARDRLPLTKVFGAGNYDHILLWHIIYYFGDCLWYLEDHNLLIIAEAEENTWHLYDILSARPFSFEALLPNILPDGLDKVVCHFTPELLDMKFHIFAREMESPLFVRGDFPLKDVAFKFPALAQT